MQESAEADLALDLINDFIFRVILGQKYHPEFTATYKHTNAPNYYSVVADE